MSGSLSCRRAARRCSALPRDGGGCGAERWPLVGLGRVTSTQPASTLPAASQRCPPPHSDLQG
ncbi:hypothetical protein E2C01_023776 [Portunus trituberculatus]|uniref:Uncharacterized protein n=1 Tax=Portunus trituberculatus TaxID=210409 RepID=A0A5B7EAY0_PORTR|nr:hypothetical protein [Portunus trituberculatus]